MTFGFGGESPEQQRGWLEQCSQRMTTRGAILKGSQTKAGGPCPFDLLHPETYCVVTVTRQSMLKLLAGLSVTIAFRLLEGLFGISERLGEHAAVAWINDRIAEGLGISGPSITQVVEFTLAWGPPTGLAMICLSGWLFAFHHWHKQQAPAAPTPQALPLKNGVRSSTGTNNQHESKLASTAPPSQVERCPPNRVNSNRRGEIASQPAGHPTRQPLSVTFADGARATIEISARLQLPPEKAPWATANFANPEEALDQIMTFLEGEVRVEFAKHTITQAQIKRRAISEDLLASSKEVVEQRFGFTVHDITLGDIRPAE
jgi:hypothetical protein